MSRRPPPGGGHDAGWSHVVTLSGSLSAVFLRPTQVKWQLMVASCYRRSGEDGSVLNLVGGCGGGVGKVESTFSPYACTL